MNSRRTRGDTVKTDDSCEIILLPMLYRLLYSTYLEMSL